MGEMIISSGHDDKPEGDRVFSLTVLLGKDRPYIFFNVDISQCQD